MRRSLSDSALDGLGALVAEPLPADHHGHERAAGLDDPHSLLAASGVASSVGPRTARAALSTRLSQARNFACKLMYDVIFIG